MNIDDTHIGRRIRQIRQARGKSLAVVAGLAGISKSYLSMIELGERAVDRRSLIVALANALEVAPSDLTALPLSAPGTEQTDASIDAVRRALQAVSLNAPGGEVQSADQLTSRVNAVVDAKQRCRHGEVGATLPALIRDVHSSIAAGRDERTLLRLAVILHHAGTGAYLHGMGAAADLCWSAVRLAGELAERLAEPAALGVAAFGQANSLLQWGTFDLAMEVLQRTDVSTGDDPQLVGMLTLTTSLVLTAQDRQSEASAALEQAAELAKHTGEGNNYYMSFGPTNVDMWRLSAALELADYDRATQLAESLDANRITAPTRRANYWVNYARALVNMPGRRDDAVYALRKAEHISADKVQRNPFAREIVGELLTKAKRDAVGRELRGMAYRAGLPV